MYNEEAYVDRAVARGARGARGDGRASWEIVVVDDASTRRHGRAGRRARPAADPRVRVVHNPVNRRLGGSLRAGYAARDARSSSSTRTPTCPSTSGELPRAVRLLEYQQADMLAAYRFDRTSEGLRRALYTFGYNLLIRMLFGLRIRDVNFAFKLFRRSLLAAHRAHERGQLHRRRAAAAGAQGGRRR